MSDTLEKLYEVVQSRRGGDPEKSYVARMFGKGMKKITQKVGEEATETIIAALAQGKKHTVQESADLLFHLVMLWAEKGVKPAKVMKELEDRMGTSGLDEKAARKDAGES